MVLILKISIINRSIGNVWKAVHKVLTWGCIRQKPAGQNRQKLTHLHDKHFWPSMKPKLKPVWVILYSLCKSHITSLGNWKTIQCNKTQSSMLRSISSKFSEILSPLLLFVIILIGMLLLAHLQKFPFTLKNWLWVFCGITR